MRHIYTKNNFLNTVYYIYIYIYIYTHKYIYNLKFRFVFYFFGCGPLKKSFFEFVAILLLFYVLFIFFFGCKTCGTLVPQPGIEPVPPALEGKVLITRPLGKPLYIFLMYITINTLVLSFWFFLCTT